MKTKQRGPNSPLDKPRRETLPTVSVAPLRAAKAVRPDMRECVIAFGDGPGAAKTVGLAHTKFWNGGGWSYFICPTCGRLAQKLRLYEGEVVCRRCDGLIGEVGNWEAETAKRRIERLQAKLAQPGILRRRRLEASLRVAMIRDRRKRLGE